MVLPAISARPLAWGRYTWLCAWRTPSLAHMVRHHWPKNWGPRSLVLTEGIPKGSQSDSNNKGAASFEVSPSLRHSLPTSHPQSETVAIHTQEERVELLSSPFHFGQCENVYRHVGHNVWRHRGVVDRGIPRPVWRGTGLAQQASPPDFTGFFENPD